ncbi:L,D-transpeptidase family protein [Candidatus Omnitrophota bacterium]
MKNRLLGAGIVLALILVLIFIAFKAGKEKETKDLSEQKIIRELISEDNLDEAKKKIDEIAVKFPDSNVLGEAYFDIADSYEKKGDLVKARDIYGLILSKYQNVDNILEVQERLGKLNVNILFSSVATNKDVFYKVAPGDTLSKIARKFGTTIDLIKTSNSLKDDTIRAHSKLKVSKARYKILIDKSQNLLTLLTKDETIFKVYRVSTGKNNSTPVGTFKIVNKIKDPVWYKQGAIVPAESPDNILGSRWLGFSEPGYGIHGTVQPESVGHQATSGCIRMFDFEVEELYTVVPVGIEVAIVD